MLGLWVAVVEDIKALAEKDCSDLAPHLN